MQNNAIDCFVQLILVNFIRIYENVITFNNNTNVTFIWIDAHELNYCDIIPLFYCFWFWFCLFVSTWNDTQFNTLARTLAVPTNLLMVMEFKRMFLFYWLWIGLLSPNSFKSPFQNELKCSLSSRFLNFKHK